MICTKAFLGILDRVREMSLLFDRQILGLTLVPFGLPPTPTPTPISTPIPPKKMDIKYDQKINNFDAYRGGMDDDNNNNNSEILNYKNTNTVSATSDDAEYGRKESAEATAKLQSSIRAPAVVSIIVNKDIVG